MPDCLVFLAVFSTPTMRVPAMWALARLLAARIIRVAEFRLARVGGLPQARMSQLGPGRRITGPDFFGDGWEVSAYVLLNDARRDEAGPASHDRSYSGGVSFSIDAEGYPALSAGVDLNHFETILPAIDYGIRDQDLSFNFGLDFLKFLPEIAPAQKPYLHIKAYSDVSMSDESATGRTISTGRPF